MSRSKIRVGRLPNISYKCYSLSQLARFLNNRIVTFKHKQSLPSLIFHFMPDSLLGSGPLSMTVMSF
jgi:hypothetical protein